MGKRKKNEDLFTDPYDDEFQILLQTFAYPFLACVDAMKATGYQEKEAVEFGKGVWYKFTPVLFRG